MTNRLDRGSNKPRGAERFERDDVIRDRSADFIRASSHAVLHEQAEHMDAPDRCSSLHKSSCTAGAAADCPVRAFARPTCPLTVGANVS